MDVTFLQTLLYLLGVVLLVALIVLTIKLIYSIGRINFLLDDIEKKMKTVNKAFIALDKIVDSISFASDKIVDGVVSVVAKIFERKDSHKEKRKIKEEREEK